jgi:hypothetical protein
MENKKNNNDALGCAFYMIDYAYRTNQVIKGDYMSYLLLIANGLYLKLTNNPLFDDDIIIHFGRVNNLEIKSIDNYFHSHKKIPQCFVGFNPDYRNDLPHYMQHKVDLDDDDIMTVLFYKNDCLDKMIQKVLENVVDNFSKLSHFELSSNALLSTPLYKNNYVDDGMYILPLDEIKEYYQTIIFNDIIKINSKSLQQTNFQKHAKQLLKKDFTHEELIELINSL